MFNASKMVQLALFQDHDFQEWDDEITTEYVRLDSVDDSPSTMQVPSYEGR
jgi:hypothetical protein